MALPNFLVIGAAKAGTTSLYHYLGQHPDIYFSPIKEPGYYCDEEQLDGIPAIRARRDYERLFARVTGERAIGEASPKYLNALAGVERIHTDLPGVRLVVSLRNPADRAYSSYLGKCQNGLETRGPEEALRPGHYCFDTSFYYPRLRRYLDRFDRRQIKVILFEELVARPQATVADIFQFLDVDPDVVVDTTEAHNSAVIPRFAQFNRLVASSLRRARPLAPRFLLWKGYGRRLRSPLFRRPDPLAPGLRAHLLEQYCDDIRATGALIGRDLSHWLRQGTAEAR